MFSLAQAHRAFDDHSRIADAQLQARFDMTIADFMAIVEASKHYPRVKQAWVEYLGEHRSPRSIAWSHGLDLREAGPKNQGVGSS